jgi:lipopolysaccharide export system protein LptA
MNIFQLKRYLLFHTVMIICLLSNVFSAVAVEKGKEEIHLSKKNKKNQDRDVIELSGADEGEYIRMSDSGQGIVILRGNIKMRSDHIIIHARRVVYNRDTGDVTFSENVHFDDGKNRMSAHKGIFNVKDRTGVLYGASSSDKPVFFTSKQIKIIDKEKYIGEELCFTTCDLERPHYHFKVEKVWIHSDKRLVAYNAIYIVGDIPLFYFPVVVHTDEGIGIITQFGRSKRRGNFIQNTLRYTSGDGGKWKYKLDIYEKLGYYGGFEFSKRAKDFSLDMYFAGARFKPVDEDLNNSSLLEDESWYKVSVLSDLSFFKRKRADSYVNLKFEWMNNWDFERSFDNRNEPKTTIEMIRWIPRNVIDVRRYLDWHFTISDRSDRYNVSLSFKRRWIWNDTLNPDEIDDYSIKGLYQPLYDQLPVFSFVYNGSFALFEGDEGIQKKRGQIFNWNLYLGGNSYKQYLFGEHFRTTYTYGGYYNINTVFPFLVYFSYIPGIKVGFNAQQVKDPNDETRDSSELDADKNTFQYVESEQALKFGSTKYYLQVTHFYRRSYLEKEVIEPFIHERLNYFEGGLFLFPFDGIDMTVTSSYDARRKFPFEDERWRDVIVKNSVFFDFYSYLKDRSLNSRKRGLFFSGIEVLNNYKYIAKEQTSGYNTFDISFMTGNFSIFGIKNVRNVEVGYNWFHDFRFPFRDMMSIRWNITADLSRLWRVDIGGNSQADRSYLLYGEQDGTSPFDEVKKSLYFYDRSRSRNAVFTLRNFHIDLIHDLHCWEVGISYHLERDIERIGLYNRDRLVFYEQRIFITLRIKSFSEIGLTGAQVYGTKRGTQF